MKKYSVTIATEDDFEPAETCERCFFWGSCGDEDSEACLFARVGLDECPLCPREEGSLTQEEEDYVLLPDIEGDEDEGEIRGF